jgi:hypothetical protein
MGLLSGLAMWVVCACAAMASAYHGQVTFSGLPLPGSVVSVTATQGEKKAVAVSDDQGLFSFADLADGKWELDIEMTGFAPLKEEITVAPNAPLATFEMKLLTLDEIRAAAKPVKVDVTAPVVASVAAPSTQVSEAKPGAPGSAAAPAAKGAAKTTAAAGGPAAPAEAAPGGAAASQDATSAQANDGFLVNGSVNNAATSQFSLNQAFGNNRSGGRWLYNGGLSLVLQNSDLNAKNFSINGEDSPKPPYTDIVAGAQIGGPLKIPHFLPASRAPYFQFGYQRTENKTDTINPALMPTPAEIAGNLSAAPNVTSIYVPANGQLSAACLSQPGVVPGQVFPGNVIPTQCISAQAQALLAFYPAPNLTGISQYNYQVPLASDTHTDAYRFTLQKQLGTKNNLNGNMTVQDTRTSTPSIFGFLDTGGTLNTGVNANWYHRFTQRLSMNAGYSFSRSRNTTTSYFANKTNVEGNAGITGNDTSPTYWGPPGLGFSSGIQGLGDATNSSNRPETNSVSYYMTWNRFRHNMTFGGDFRRQEWNYLTESNPRGSLYFSGAQTASSATPGSGSDFADFLLGLPDTSAIAYGNADKYLRQSVYDLYVDDDFRVNPELSIRAGLRWEFGAPVTETENRLVNLDVLPGFTNEAAVVGTNPKGPLTGESYPSALIHPDYSFPDPRVGIAWRPISGSSLLVNAGYGIYNDTSVYRSTAYAMAQQAPLSTSLSVANSASCRFTTAAPFQQLPCATTTADTFAVDPNFKVGYAQQWQLQVRRDLPFSLQLQATYTGIKGSHGVQEIVPNSYGLGLTASPYGTAPVGYYYRDSLGNSTKESGSIQLRRRLRNGFTANLNYTYSKALDDDFSLGGQGSVISGGSGSSQVAQDWTHPGAQRGLSTFDQRNVLNATLQYTTGMGLGGHTMMSGWRGLVYKDWTVLLTISEASGTPQTPIDPAVLPGTSFANILRANYVGGAVHKLSPGGIFLNQAAFTVPTSGFGNAGRDSITGPSQFGLNASMNRSFRIHDRYNLSAQIDANNVLNHVAYSGWNTTVGPLFGTVAGAGGMRSVVITLRGRF